MSKLILASASPRRKDLLKYLGLDFSIEIADIDESPLAKESPADLVLRLAAAKADKISESFNDSWILAADTVVALGPKIYGKPLDRNDAKNIINELAGKTHTVFSAFTVVNKAQNIKLSYLSAVYVKFRQISELELEKHLDSATYLDKAGAYAMQEHATIFIEKINGNPAAVIGLDIVKVHEVFVKLGIL